MSNTAIVPWEPSDDNYFLAEYIQQCLRTESDRPPRQLTVLEWRVVHAAFGLSDEVGEIAKAVKATLFYGAPLDVANIREELGDVCWYLALLCDALGIDWCEALVANIRKLRARYPDRFTTMNALNRDLQREAIALE